MHISHQRSMKLQFTGMKHMHPKSCAFLRPATKTLSLKLAITVPKKTTPMRHCSIARSHVAKTPWRIYVECSRRVFHRYLWVWSNYSDEMETQYAIPASYRVHSVDSWLVSMKVACFDFETGLLKRAGILIDDTLVCMFYAYQFLN